MVLSQVVVALACIGVALFDVGHGLHAQPQKNINLHLCSWLLCAPLVTLIPPGYSRSPCHSFSIWLLDSLVASQACLFGTILVIPCPPSRLCAP